MAAFPEMNATLQAASGPPFFVARPGRDQAAACSSATRRLITSAICQDDSTIRILRLKLSTPSRRSDGIKDAITKLEEAEPIPANDRATRSCSPSAEANAAAMIRPSSTVSAPETRSGLKFSPFDVLLLIRRLIWDASGIQANLNCGSGTEPHATSSAVANSSGSRLKGNNTGAGINCHAPP